MAYVYIVTDMIRQKSNVLLPLTVIAGARSSQTHSLRDIPVMMAAVILLNCQRRNNTNQQRKHRRFYKQRVRRGSELTVRMSDFSTRAQLVLVRMCRGG